MLPEKFLKSRHHWTMDIVLLGMVLTIFYTFWLGSYPLFTPDEGRYSEVAREMIATGDYITPRLNGVAFLDKPILYYWLQAGAMKLFGINEWALRFFPALFGVFGCLLTYSCGRLLFDRRTGLISAILLATSPLYFIGAHYANLDLEVAVLISCTLLLFMTGVQRKGKSRHYFLILAYISAALAFLTKGLIGIAFPAIITGIWVLLLNQWRLLTKIHLIKGIVLFSMIVFPWYYLVQQANPAFLHYFFVTQQVTRFLSTAKFNNPTPFWFYLPVILLGFIPWTVFLIQAFGNSIRHIWNDRHSHQTELFLLIWVLFVLLFFSIPHSKMITYILPVFPALALLVGKYLSSLFSQQKKLLPVLAIAASCNALFLLILTMNAKHFNQCSVKPLVTHLKTIMQAHDEVITYFKFYQDLPLYLGQRITIVANWNSPRIPYKDNWVRELWYGMTFQDTSGFLINENEFWKRWKGNKRLFVFLGENYLEQFKQHTQKIYLIGQTSHILLLSNQPAAPKP